MTGHACDLRHLRHVAIAVGRRRTRSIDANQIVVQCHGSATRTQYDWINIIHIETIQWELCFHTWQWAARDLQPFSSLIWLWILDEATTSAHRLWIHFRKIKKLKYILFEIFEKENNSTFGAFWRWTSCARRTTSFTLWCCRSCWSGCCIAGLNWKKKLIFKFVFGKWWILLLNLDLHFVLNA